MKFRDLKIGETFDFIGPDRYNSFFEPCKKISTRKYKYPSGKPAPFHFYICQVGSLDAEIFHVGREFPANTLELA